MEYVPRSRLCEVPRRRVVGLRPQRWGSAGGRYRRALHVRLSDITGITGTGTDITRRPVTGTLTVLSRLRAESSHAVSFPTLCETSTCIFYYLITFRVIVTYYKENNYILSLNIFI